MLQTRFYQKAKEREKRVGEGIGIQRKVEWLSWRGGKDQEKRDCCPISKSLEIS